MKPSSQNAASERRAAILSLVIGILLMLMKFAAFWMTGSAAILSDALESIVNVLAGGFALYAIIVAHLPADQEHPYGHGKIEFLSAGFEGGMIALAALFIVGQALREIHRGPEVRQIDSGIGLVAAATLINGALGFYLISLGRRGGSIALEADGKHLLGDAVTSIVVLVSLGAVKLTGIHLIDPLAAIAVAIYIVWMAVGLLRRSAAGLMDEQDRGDDAKIRQILDSHIAPAGKDPFICSYHKLRHRHSGRYHWVDFHIMVPSEMSVDRGHKIASAIEYEIELALGEGNATAHVEPCQSAECPVCRPSENPAAQRAAQTE